MLPGQELLQRMDGIPPYSLKLLPAPMVADELREAQLEPWASGLRKNALIQLPCQRQLD